MSDAPLRKGRFFRMILGVDPGSSVTGYGIVGLQRKDLVLIDYGVIRTKDKNLSKKLKEVFDGLTKIIKKFHPDEFAIEEAFYSKNARVALVMGEVRGVAILAAVKSSLSVAEYSPKEIKSAVVGSGNASKVQVQYMVKNLLRLKKVPTPADASDALAVALCHHQKINTQRRIV
jgi:crossover junction endodeoxyribonuclease RuvC